MASATFDERLAERSALHPHDVAVVADGSEDMTYAELDRRVGDVAARLIAAGIGEGERVAVVADNSPAHLVAAFAVWRAGATLVTIYPSSGSAELAFAIDDADPSLVVAGSRVLDSVRRATRGTAPVVELTESETVVDVPVSSTARTSAPATDSPALICYTSGSTSRPKAVMHTHAGLLAAAEAYAGVWHLDRRDTSLVALPLAWAFGLVTTSMATLVGGGRVVLASRADPVELLRHIANDRVTFLPGVTTFFVRLVGAIEQQLPDQPDVSSLRLCISGGEPRNESVFARWERLTGRPVHDVYAASECFPVVTYDPGRDPHPRAGAAGRVVPGADLRVVDADGGPCPMGIAGEAWTRGPAMSIGYWHDAELTRATFTTDGWYRSGDVVHVDADGYVHVVGRQSDLIIRGGANVSPAEVEAVLLQHAAVHEAAVVGLANADHGQDVVAAVVLAPKAELDVEELRTHCAKALASYKVPVDVVAVDSLLRNANTGKVQRRDVAALLADRNVVTSTGAAS